MDEALIAGSWKLSGMVAPVEKEKEKEGEGGAEGGQRGGSRGPRKRGERGDTGGESCHGRADGD